jgi:hypothetical protein
VPKAARNTDAVRSGVMPSPRLFRLQKPRVQMRRKLSASLLTAGVAAASVLAQNAAPSSPPAADARVIRVRIGHSYGMCAGGYCSDSTTIEPEFIVSEYNNAPDKKKFPDRTMKSAITRQYWETLRHAIDAKSLLAARPSACHAEIDLPCSWVEVDYSDGAKIRVSYGGLTPPAPVAALLAKVAAVR